MCPAAGTFGLSDAAMTESLNYMQHAVRLV